MPDQSTRSITVVFNQYSLSFLNFVVKNKKGGGEGRGLLTFFPRRGIRGGGLIEDLLHIGGTGMVQHWNYRLPTNVIQVQVPLLMPHVAWVRCWFTSFSGYSSFPLSPKTNIQNFQFDLEIVSSKLRTVGLEGHGFISSWNVKCHPLFLVFKRHEPTDMAL